MTPKRLRPRPFACALILGLMIGLAPVAAIAAQPVITGVVIVDVGVMNVGTTATAEILVQSDSATFTLDVSSDIGSYGLDAGTFVKSTNEKYTVQFDVDEGENDYAAGLPIPVSITLWDGGVSGTWNTPITYGSAIDANSPTKPGAPDLDAASDNGQSATDDVTNDDTPRFNGGAGSVEGSATVEVASSIDGPLGTAPANADGSWTYTVPGGSELADGSHAITITATDAAGNESVPSDPLNVLMDTQAPNDPGNRAPADNAWVNTTSPTFSWRAPGDPGGSGVYNYRVQIWGPATRSYYTAGLSYNPSLGAEGTYTWRLYALDVAGNNGDVGASTWTLNLDTTDPTVSTLAENLSVIAEANAGDKTFSLTIDYSEAMDTGVAPTVSFPVEDPTSTITLDTGIGGSGWSDSNTYVARYDVVDANEEIDDIDVRVTGAQDVAGNPQTQYDESDVFSIDTVKPTVTVNIVDTSLYDGDNSSLVTFEFSEVTSDFVEGDLTVVGGVISVFTAVDGDSYTATYTATDGIDTTGSVTVDAGSYTDAAGNLGATGTDTVVIDTLNPTVLSITNSDSLISDSDAGGQYTEWIVFSESMRDWDTPELDHPPCDAAFGATCTFANFLWYQTTYEDDSFRIVRNVADTGVACGPMSIDVSGIHDLAGNLVVSDSLADALSIDTLNSTVSGVSTNDPLITDVDTPGDATFVVTIEFSEPMDAGVAPTVGFSPAIASTLTLDWTSGWLDSDTYEAKYDVSDGNVDHDSLTIDVTGAKDTNGNDQQDYTPLHEFEIDTVNPTVTNVSADDTLLSDSDAGTSFTVSVDFSEAMTTDGSADPTITFNPAIGTTLAFASENWTTSTRYTATYDVADAGVDHDSVTIDVSGAKDAVGNDQQDYMPVHEFEVDTLNPTVAGVALSDNLITDADVGGTFTVTIDYSEPMLAATAPTLVFSPTLDTTLALQGVPNSRWETTQQYVASYTILDGNVTVLDDDITISAAQDLAGNVQVAYNYDDQFDVDTENPYFHDFTVTGGAVDDTCLRVVTFEAKVTDPNGTMVPGDITVTNVTVTNATIGAVYDVSQTSDSQTMITITGKVDVTALTGCPARVTITLDAVDSVDNTAAQQSQSDDVVDTTNPVINDLLFNTDDTYAVEQIDPYLVDECGFVVVYFSANVTDNCCIVPADVTVTVTLPMLPGEGAAILEGIDVTRVQNGQDRVDVTGNAVVRCLESCPPGVCMSRVQVDISAADCCGNAAIPDATGIGEGLVDDIILPIPRDDPRQDMVMDESAVIDPLVEVRLDEFGTYRLILRESTPVRIDVMGNDADNLSHNAAHPFGPCIACGACGGQTGCCAIMYIHEIVEPPSYGTVTIEDDAGDCAGGTVIRYAPDQGRLGPDYFTYRTRDTFDNVSSVIATVYLQTVEETVMEDVAVIACSGEPTEFDVVAADLWVDRDPAVITFGFEIVNGPVHGVVVGDLAQIVLSPASLGPDPNTGELVPTLDFTEAAGIQLTYTSAIGYVGRDTMMIRIDDPFGAFAIAEVDIRVIECAPGVGEVPTIEVGQDVVFPIIVPESFAVMAETSPGAVILMSLEDGLVYPGALSILWSEEINRHVLLLETGPLPLGRYWLTIPMGDGDRVELIVETGEVE